MASVISVDGVLLPNKPLSNFEIEDTIKNLGVPGFEAFLCEIAYRINQE